MQKEIFVQERCSFVIFLKVLKLIFEEYSNSSIHFWRTFLKVETKRKSERELVNVNENENVHMNENVEKT